MPPTSQSGIDLHRILMKDCHDNIGRAEKHDE